MDSTTDEVIIPNIIICNRNFKYIASVGKTSSLKYTNKINEPDEISFLINKTLNEKELNAYDLLDNFTVVYVEDIGYFEIYVSEDENENGIYKNVSGKELPYAELDNINVNLEINTEDDVARDDYDAKFPTIFYRNPNDCNKYSWDDTGYETNEKRMQILKESSLMHRILTYLPHYSIGHVDETLYYVNSTYSWSSQKALSVLNEIAEEVGCIFTFEVGIENGQPIRKINAYDKKYCKSCYEQTLAAMIENSTDGVSMFRTMDTNKFRSIINETCSNCNTSTNIKEYGNDTPIFVNTKNLTGEIKVDCDEENVKNTIKIIGGDDLITDTISGISPSGTNKLMCFSDFQLNQMTKTLREKIAKYNEDYLTNRDTLSQIMTTYYNILDLMQYLQSGKMPTKVTEEKTLREEISYLFGQHDYFYVDEYNNFKYNPISLSTNAIQKLLSLYIDDGFSLNITTDSIIYDNINMDLDNNVESKRISEISWYGTIRIQNIDDTNEYADIVIDDNSDATIYYNKQKDESGNNLVETFSELRLSILQYMYQNQILNYGEFSFESETAFNKYYNSFSGNTWNPKIRFGDYSSSAYQSFLMEHINYEISESIDVKFKNFEEKQWDKYSYNYLDNFYCGYLKCIDTLREMKTKSKYTDSSYTKDGVIYENIETYLLKTYSKIANSIRKKMNMLKDQINALYQFIGDYTDDMPEYIYTPYTYSIYNNMKDALTGIKNTVGNKPVQCLFCNSTNVGLYQNNNGVDYVICNNCGSNDVVTYQDIATEVLENYELVKTFTMTTVSGVKTGTDNLFSKFLIKGDEDGFLYSTSNVNNFFAIFCDENCNYLETNKISLVQGTSSTYDQKYYYYLYNPTDVDVNIVENYQSGANNYTVPSKSLVAAKYNTYLSEQWSTSGDITINGDIHSPTFVINTNVSDSAIYLIRYYYLDSIYIDVVSNISLEKNINQYFSDLSQKSSTPKYIITSDFIQDNIVVKSGKYNITSLSNKRDDIYNNLNVKNYFDESYSELYSFIREDVYDNNNYSSDGIFLNKLLFQKAYELYTKSQKHLLEICEPQYTITVNLYALIAEVRKSQNVEFCDFILGNFIRVQINNQIYKVRLTSITFDYENVDTIETVFTDAIKITKKNIYWGRIAEMTWNDALKFTWGDALNDGLLW